jgi:hypothetical protein
LLRFETAIFIILNKFLEIIFPQQKRIRIQVRFLIGSGGVFKKGLSLIIQYVLYILRWVVSSIAYEHVEAAGVKWAG